MTFPFELAPVHGSPGGNLPQPSYRLLDGIPRPRGRMYDAAEVFARAADIDAGACIRVRLRMRSPSAAFASLLLAIVLLASSGRSADANIYYRTGTTVEN